MIQADGSCLVCLAEKRAECLHDKLILCRCSLIPIDFSAVTQDDSVSVLILLSKLLAWGNATLPSRLSGRYVSWTQLWSALEPVC